MGKQVVETVTVDVPAPYHTVKVPIVVQDEKPVVHAVVPETHSHHHNQVIQEQVIVDKSKNVVTVTMDEGEYEKFRAEGGRSIKKSVETIHQPVVETITVTRPVTETFVTETITGGHGHGRLSGGSGMSTVTGTVGGGGLLRGGTTTVTETVRTAEGGSFGGASNLGLGGGSHIHETITVSEPVTTTVTETISGGNMGNTLSGVSMVGGTSTGMGMGGATSTGMSMGGATSTGMSMGGTSAGFTSGGATSTGFTSGGATSTGLNMGGLNRGFTTETVTTETLSTGQPSLLRSGHMPAHHSTRILGQH